MEDVQALLTVFVGAATLLSLLRWILAGGRRRYAARDSRAARYAHSSATWSHVGMRRRDLASSGGWQYRMR